VYMVSAWCNQNSSILGQMRTQDKSNEITAIPELLKLLDIKGLTVTIDAIGCQREIVQQIVMGNKADYVIGLKRNQPVMYEEFSLYTQDTLLTGRKGTDYQHTQSIEKGHGRIERRDYYLFPDVHWYKDHKAWKNLQSVVMIKSRREVLGNR
jgi:predicted transposase YbfD/YdcC